MAQTMIGTSRIRPSVIMFGILTRRFPPSVPFPRKRLGIRGFRGPDQPLVFILYAHGVREPLRGFEIPRNQAGKSFGRYCMTDRKNGLTYAEAGVDIDAGNRLVDLIKPMVRATARAGADAEIGGFGGLFDLKAAGFKDPVLVAATDGVGTKVKIAIETGLHDGIGIDLVAMSVNDLVVQGAEPLF